MVSAKKSRAHAGKSSKKRARVVISRSARKPSQPRPKAKAPSRPKATVSRSRATTPARATHASTTHVAKLKPRRVKLIPSPLPTRHVAPKLPAVVMPARSMPPARDQRKVMPTPTRGPLVIPDFTEAGVLLAITYSIRDGRRGEFFDLMRELKPLLGGIGGTDCTVYEDRTRPNYFMEVFRFKDEAEFTAFDDKFHKDRKIAAIYALLDDIVEAEKSDFKIFERRL
jgi:hypothetical protein